MSRAAMALGGLVVAMAAGALGYWRGQADGAAGEVARQDAHAVQQLTGLIASHTTLIDQARTASAGLRKTMSARAAQDQQFSKEFRDALTLGGGALAAASKERQDVRQDLTQADSDLLSETLNETLLAWICEYNGLAPCLVYRQIKDEEDTKALAEADKIVSERRAWPPVHGESAGAAGFAASAVRGDHPVCAGRPEPQRLDAGRRAVATGCWLVGHQSSD